MDDMRSFPLGSSDIDNPDTAFFRQVSFNPIYMSLLPGESNTRSDIDTELHHLKSIIQEKLPESGGCFPLIFGANRQIKSYH